ncbi:MAG: hypothetical protein JW839_14135 [Candidatus Lokiarchaeota archaeon]|nr:hypothetical protein [Candidatus Lokiarchaeota archaeon]
MPGKNLKAGLGVLVALVAICQLSMVTVPVKGLAWEVTTWINDGSSYGRGSALSPNDVWHVEWDVLQGGWIDVEFENPSSTVFHSITGSPGGTYEFTASENGTYYANFLNPLDGGGSVQVYILTENKGPAINVPGFSLIIVLALVGLLTIPVYRKVKRTSFS